LRGIAQVLGWALLVAGVIGLIIGLTTAGTFILGDNAVWVGVLLYGGFTLIVLGAVSLIVLIVLGAVNLIIARRSSNPSAPSDRTPPGGLSR
jgi:hypothetical protein